MNANQWIFCIGIAALSVPIGALLRTVPIGAEFSNKQPAQKDFQKVAKQVLAHEVYFYIILNVLNLINTLGRRKEGRDYWPRRSRLKKVLTAPSNRFRKKELLAQNSR